MSGSLCTLSILWAYIYVKSRGSGNQKKLPAVKFYFTPCLFCARHIITVPKLSKVDADLMFILIL